MFSHSSQPPAFVKCFAASALFGPSTNVAIGTTEQTVTTTHTHIADLQSFGTVLHLYS